MTEDRIDRLRQQAMALPEAPGCYQFRASSGRLLYVGKARSLRDRVTSYFRGWEAQPPKTRALVGQIASLEIILCPDEVEALILENSLVKRHRPRFNVLLRDDKNFPYLKLTVGDAWPRVVLVRRPRLDGALYFGPFTPASVARRSLKMVARYFQVATCHEPFDGSRRRPCILYQMRQCLAPCVGYAEGPAYGRAVADVRLFLEGRDADLRQSLAAQMEAASARLDYESAAGYRDLLATMRALRRRPSVASVGLDEQDYFALHRVGGRAALEVFEVRGGLLQTRREFFLEDEEGEDSVLLGEAVTRYYAAAPVVPRRLFVSVEPAEVEVLEAWLRRRAGTAVAVRVPRRGAHRVLLNTALDNARLAWEGRFAADQALDPAVADGLRELAGSGPAPIRLEGFDIAHLQGRDTVASVVVWEAGRARRSDYRRMRIRTADPGDDYAAIREAVRRRYGRLQREGRPLPDLALIDGGPGQLRAAQGALDELGLNVPLVALAKREEEVFRPGQAEPVAMPRDAPVRLLLMRIRDEAHRFAGAYHRLRRRARTLRTDLTEVPGIGPERARRLLRRFGSVAGVRRASADELAAAVGPQLARRLREALDGAASEPAS